MRLDLIGQTFGRLTVTESADVIDGRGRMVCLCECGMEKIILSTSLTRGHTQSCGCLHKEKLAERAKKKRGIKKKPLLNEMSTEEVLALTPKERKSAEDAQKRADTDAAAIKDIQDRQSQVWDFALAFKKLQREGVAR